LTTRCATCKDLLDTMHAAPGIGITAPHVGISCGHWCSTSA
jgi:peptide deformylase